MNLCVPSNIVIKYIKLHIKQKIYMKQKQNMKQEQNDKEIQFQIHGGKYLTTLSETIRSRRQKISRKDIEYLENKTNKFDPAER